VCWDPFREGQINALDRVRRKAEKYANLTNDSNWEALGQRIKTARICALYKAYSGEPAWKAVGDRLQRSYHLSRVDHDWIFRNRRHRRDIGKNSF
jgi:hypothetical protein